MKAYYFVEMSPEYNQLIYIFHCSEENAVRPSYSKEIGRYLGDGIIVNQHLNQVRMEAGLAWEPCNEKLIPAKV